MWGGVTLDGLCKHFHYEQEAECKGPRLLLAQVWGLGFRVYRLRSMKIAKLYVLRRQITRLL